MPNHLAGESSPYLRQHAENPVDWYPWGEAALDKARREDRLIYLSVGYAACHWCHVMAHESFEDPTIAALLNERYVSVKVDREERPDIDRIYMSAVQAMTGNGGWPMSVFLTPEGHPIYAGTYFPPQERHGLPAFRAVLGAVADAWEQRRDELLASGESIVAALRQSAMDDPGALSHDGLDEATLSDVVESLQQRFDERHGGWGDAPKFPQPMLIEFLLRQHHVDGDGRALQMVVSTLTCMARGGIYDQIGGGFHRYSVDDHWLVPHFEKMLYDNAQLARVYLHAWQVTGDALFRAVAQETLDYVLRELRDPAGGFCASQDADSGDGEGEHYLWTAQELREALGEKAGAFCAAYGVTDSGNLAGRTVLSLRGDLADRFALSDARLTLRRAREQRALPRRDDKVIASWNGLMVAALAEAGAAFGNDAYISVAAQSADLLLGELRGQDGRLMHVWQDGHARVLGFLDDYACLIDGLLALHQVTQDARWLAEARRLADIALIDFAAPVGLFDTSSQHEALVLRPRELQDTATPSGNAMMALDLVRLSALTGHSGYQAAADEMLRGIERTALAYPAGFAQWLIALRLDRAPRRAIVIVDGDTPDETNDLVAACRRRYLPHTLLVVGEQQGITPYLYYGRLSVEGRATAYVCTGNTCAEPVVTSEALARELG